MTEKPRVRLKDWNFISGLRYFKLNGTAVDHPKGPRNCKVTTGPVIRYDFEKKEAETFNTIYLLEDGGACGEN